MTPEELTRPCGHERPQAASQLHGVCIFCWRDRAGALRAENEQLKTILNERNQTLRDARAALDGRKS